MNREKRESSGGERKTNENPSNCRTQITKMNKEEKESGTGERKRIENTNILCSDSNISIPIFNTKTPKKNKK